VEGLPEAEANLLMKEWYESKHKDEWFKLQRKDPIQPYPL
jgi:hypothetical protein